MAESSRPATRVVAADVPAGDENVAPVASLLDVPIRRGRFQPVRPASAKLPEEGDSAGICAWWRGLRRGNRLPSLGDLDKEAIAARWTGAILLRFDQRQCRILGAGRVGQGEDPRTGVVDYSPMLTEWLLALAEQAARAGAPVEERRDFPVPGGSRRYAVLVLPFAADAPGGRRGEAEHLLCCVRRC